MPEDQGVNGDAWNNEASKLLSLFNWKQIGDANVDVVNSEGKKQGIDRMYKYSDIRKSKSLDQAVFVEAKCYKTTSFKISQLKDWILTLSNKISKSKKSEKFLKTYPDFENCSIKSGLIVLWFSDTEEYHSIRSKLKSDMRNLIIPSGKLEDNQTRIFILDNYDILRLASLAETVEQYKLKNKTEIRYYYPSIDYFVESAASSSDILTLEYMFSQFVLASAKCEGRETYIVFYFGDLSTQSFRRLRSALQKHGYIHIEKPLRIYKYNRDDEFRKIKPDIDAVFSDIDFKLHDMIKFADLPPFMKQED